MGHGASAKPKEVVITEVKKKEPGEPSSKPATPEPKAASVPAAASKREASPPPAATEAGKAQLVAAASTSDYAAQPSTRIDKRMGTHSGAKIIQTVAQYNRGDEYAVLIIGAGPAGVKAAIEAASRGMRVGLLDVKANITGAPTGAHSKCLREAVLVGAKTWEEVGDVASRTVKAALSATQRQLRIFHVEVMHGHGKVLNATSLSFTPASGALPRTLKFETLIIATGSVANRFPPVDYTLPGVFDSDSIWNIDRLPKNLLIQGAGIIGLEYGLIFKKLGTQSVTVIDMGNKIAPMLDCDLQEAVVQTMAEEGITLVLNSKFVKVEAGEGSTVAEPKILVTIQGDKVYEGDCLLSACGRSGASTGIGLEALEAQGLKVGRGKFIETDENGWTKVGKIYAVGDVVGGNLATVGQAQAIRAIRTAYGSGRVLKEKTASCKPFGVWTIPELAWAGVTEEQAKKDGILFDTVKVPFNRTVRGCVTNEKGFLKMIYKKASGNIKEPGTGEVIGVHMFGENACDLINFGAEVISKQDTVFDILQFVFPAVTYHELYHLAASEAKLRIMHHGAKDLEAATLWWRVEEGLRKTALAEGRDWEDMLYKAFLYMDVNGSGVITDRELAEALRGLGLDLDEEQIAEMVEEATGSAELRNIDYQHFLKVFHDYKGVDRQVS